MTRGGEADRVRRGDKEEGEGRRGGTKRRRGTSWMRPSNLTGGRKEEEEEGLGLYKEEETSEGWVTVLCC